MLVIAWACFAFDGFVNSFDLFLKGTICYVVGPFLPACYSESRCKYLQLVVGPLSSMKFVLVLSYTCIIEHF